jgi:hypothetical protein
LLHRVLVPDLFERARAPSHGQVLVARYAREADAGYTSSPYEEWLQEVVEQVGACWILSCAFVRILKDQGLLGRRPLLEGQHFDSATGWLLSLFRELAHSPGIASIFGAPQNGLWRLPLSDEASRALIDFFWKRDATSLPAWSFEEGLDLFEALYQGLSSPLREQHALLSTPSFVVDFILEWTLEPALAAFRLQQVRLVDPVCGSGGFLLRAFERLYARHQQREPGGSAREHALAALAQVHGVDIAPLATLVTRIRLTLAFLKQAGLSRLEEVPSLPLNIVAADSLLRGFTPGRSEGLAADAEMRLRGYPDTDESESADHLLGQGYHVVVGNPPYLTSRDAGRRQIYRERYTSAQGNFALSVPFTERFFQLAIEGGFVGFITSNAFMKREFGRALVENVLPRIELTHIIDTSGAYIPGHGTPTVILLGRNHPASSSTVRGVLSKRGEPTIPAEPARGRVWSVLIRHLNDVGYEDDFIQVTDLSRMGLKTHPWPLAAGLAADVLRLLEQQSVPLGECVAWLGQGSWTGMDEIFFMPGHMAARLALEKHALRPVVFGESVRHWAAPASMLALAPYSKDTQEPFEGEESAAWVRYLWPYRAVLTQQKHFNSTSFLAGAGWWKWSFWREGARQSSLTLISPVISSYNHFVAERGGRLTAGTVLKIELRDGASEEDLLVLLAYLNTSAACFWMKQNLFSRERNLRRPHAFKVHPEENLYDFSPRLLGQMPVPMRLLQPGTLREQVLALARRLDQVAQEREACSPRHVLARWPGGSRDSLLRALAHAQQKEATLFRQMVCDQEDLDWMLYGVLGLVEEAAAHGAPGFALPEHRPFKWLSEMPPKRLSPSLAEPWSFRRRELRQKRALALLETALYKRPWRSDPESKADDYREQVATACREWLLGRLEQSFQTMELPRAAALGELVSSLRNQVDADAVASVYSSQVGAGLEQVIEAMLELESAPYLAALRHTPSGLEKRAIWESTWLCQRSGVDMHTDCPVPPQYEPEDFQRAHLWHLRGRWDVPRERFILYPNAGSKPLYGWAGWDPVQRACVLMRLHSEQKGQGASEELVPILGGLLELLPWIEQWHHVPDPRLGGVRPDEQLRSFILHEAQSLGTSVEVIRTWRPEQERQQGS